MIEPAKPRPRLPRPLSLPLGLVPERMQSLAAAQALNRVFDRERTEGELDLLDGKHVRIRVDDAGTAFTSVWPEGLPSNQSTGRQ